MQSGVREVLIVGGGVMGCACAWRLARDGAKVTVLERSVPGAEASSAAAGILGAQAEAHGPGPMTELALASRELYADFARELESAAGFSIGYRRSGLLRVAFDAAGVEALASASRWQADRGLSVETLDAATARELEPALAEGVAGGVHYPDDARLEPRRLLRALHIAAERAGVKFRSGAYVRALALRDDRACGVLLEDGSELAAEEVLVAAGSWTSLIAGLPVGAQPVRPARGQIVELASDAPLLDRVVFGPRCYLVPREDGRTLVGSTLEFVGYRREVTASAMRDLTSAAIELVPALADARIGQFWSNFRPYTQDERPLIGRTSLPGLTLATGHYRNGILLAPITAEIVAAVIEGRPAPVALDAFGPERAWTN